MKPRIALFMKHPECSRQSVSGLIEVFRNDYKIKIVSNDFFTPENLKEVDVVAFPGGLGDADSYYTLFKRRHGNAIADFVESGGFYLGICMGAYWAGSNYFDILKDIEPVQYIKRKNADIRRSYATVAEVDWLGEKENMFFYDGCTFIRNKDDVDPVFDIHGSYSNGDPMAIVQGRIGLVGCHPESEKFWYDGCYKYIKKNWHQGKHHGLLLDFLNGMVYK